MSLISPQRKVSSFPHRGYPTRHKFHSLLDRRDQVQERGLRGLAGASVHLYLSSVRGFIVVTGCAAALSGACSWLVSVEGLSTGSPNDAPLVRADAVADSALENVPDLSRDDAGVRQKDAGSDADALAERADAGPNLHPVGTFEDGCGLPWDAFQGTLSKSDSAHSGTASCRVCARPSAAAGSNFTADDNRAAGPAQANAGYRAVAWVRTDGTGASTPVSLLLRTATPYAILEAKETPPLAVDAEWRRLDVTLAVTQPGGALNVVIYSQQRVGPTPCFLIDDIEVQKID